MYAYRWINYYLIIFRITYRRKCRGIDRGYQGPIEKSSTILTQDCQFCVWISQNTHTTTTPSVGLAPHEWWLECVYFWYSHAKLAMLFLFRIRKLRYSHGKFLKLRYSHGKFSKLRYSHGNISKFQSRFSVMIYHNFQNPLLIFFFRFSISISTLHFPGISRTKFPVSLENRSLTIHS